MSLTWVCDFAAKTWATAPADLGVCTNSNLLRSSKMLKIIDLQIEEAWSFVGCKKNKAWFCVAFEPNKNKWWPFMLVVVALKVQRHCGRKSHSEGENIAISKRMNVKPIAQSFHSTGTMSEKVRPTM